jgi:hypothetical protein
MDEHLVPTQTPANDSQHARNGEGEMEGFSQFRARMVGLSDDGATWVCHDAQIEPQSTQVSFQSRNVGRQASRDWPEDVRH